MTKRELLGRIEALEQRVASLESRPKALEQRVASLESRPNYGWYPYLTQTWGADVSNPPSTSR